MWKVWLVICGPGTLELQASPLGNLNPEIGMEALAYSFYSDPISGLCSTFIHLLTGRSYRAENCAFL